MLNFLYIKNIIISLKIQKYLERIFNKYLILYNKIFNFKNNILNYLIKIKNKLKFIK